MHSATANRHLNVYNALTGVTVYQQRLGQGTGASSSMIAAGDHVYAINEDGEVYVIKVGSKYEEMAVNKMDEPVSGYAGRLGRHVVRSRRQPSVCHPEPIPVSLDALTFEPVAPAASVTRMTAV